MPFRLKARADLSNVSLELDSATDWLAIDGSLARV